MTKNILPILVQHLKALAHPVRLRLVAMLQDGEMCGCEIMDVVGLAPSTISEHLAELRKAGLVTERKDKQWVYYRLGTDPLLEPLLAALAQDGQIRQDRRQAGCCRGTAGPKASAFCTRSTKAH